MPYANAVAVGTTAVVIGSGNYGRSTITIWNNDPSATLYLGFSAALTTSNGVPVPAGQSISFDLGSNTPVYGIVATGTISARYAEAP